MDIATQAPLANYDGRFVTISVQSGSKLIELALDANQAMRLAGELRLFANDAFESQAESNVIAWEAFRNAD